MDTSRTKANALADPVARKAPEFLSLPSVTNLQPLVIESLSMSDMVFESLADAPIKSVEVSEGNKVLELPSDIAASLFSSDFWAEPKPEPMPPKPAETASVLTYSLPSSQVSSASKRNTYDGSQKRVSNHLSSVELARSWHKAKNAATDARTSTTDAIDGTVKRLSQSRDLQESRSTATLSPEPNQSTASIRPLSALSRASKTSSHRSYKPHVDDHSDTSSEEEESEHGSSSEDERPLSQLARPHTSSNENAPLAQLRLHSLNNKSSPMILSTRMHSPPPLVATTTFISGYSHSESSSDTTLVAQSPKSNPAQPKDFKSFISTIFTNKNQATGDLGRRSQSSLGFRSSSPALTSSPIAERPMSPAIARNVSSFANAPTANPNSPPQHSEAHDTFLPTARWSMSNNPPPPQPTYLAAPHPGQFQMMQPTSNWAGVNEAYNPHLAGRMWSDSDNGGSDYGANPHVWTQHELRAAATRSEYGGSQHSSSTSFHRPAPAPMQPLVQIPGVTSMGSVLPVSRPLSPSSNPRAMSPTPMGAMSMLPPPMANANSADSNQLLKYMMYHREMANKAYEAYQSSVTAESVDGRQSAPLITIGTNGQSLPVDLANSSANLLISTSRSSSSLKYSSPLSPSSTPSKSKSRSSKGKKSSSKSKRHSQESAAKGAKSEFDELYEIAGAINAAAAAADGYLSPPLTGRSATAQPGLQRESSGTSLSTSSTGRPVGILRSVSGGGAIEGSGVARVKKGVKFDETAAAGDNERGPMTKRRKNKAKVLDS
ncbi:hypothetical protein HDU81_011024 [Chytriomyces hyalinus]|nr:hypothetical protein HDU81_011024 [Chytriomyces hyalinus]